MAASWSAPLGVPSGSRSIRPPTGSGVPAVIPASARARLLDPGAVTVAVRQERRPVRRRRHRGRRRCGVPPGNDAHVPATAEDPRVVRVRVGIGPDALDQRVASYGTLSRGSRRSHRSSSRPDSGGWTWASWKPGRTVRPRSSIDAGPRADHPSIAAIRPDGGDPAGPDRDGLGLRARVVDGVDGTAPKDEVGGDGGRHEIGSIGRRGTPDTMPRPLVTRAAGPPSATGSRAGTIDGDDQRPPAPCRLRRRPRRQQRRPRPRRRRPDRGRSRDGRPAVADPRSARRPRLRSRRR